MRNQPTTNAQIQPPVEQEAVRMMRRAPLQCKSAHRIHTRWPIHSICFYSPPVLPQCFQRVTTMGMLLKKPAQPRCSYPKVAVLTFPPGISQHHLVLRTICQLSNSKRCPLHLRFSNSCGNFLIQCSYMAIRRRIMDLISRSWRPK